MLTKLNQFIPPANPLTKTDIDAIAQGNVFFQSKLSAAALVSPTEVKAWIDKVANWAKSQNPPIVPQIIFVLPAGQKPLIQESVAAIIKNHKAKVIDGPPRVGT